MDDLSGKWLDRFDADITPAEYMRKHPFYLSLIVDDVPVNVKVIQSMLRRLNVTDVVTAGNGAEALETLKKDKEIGIVMTDMWMPVMNGAELIREIRKEEQWKDLRVYAVTADVETQKTFKDSGFTGILLKPIKLSQLQSTVESLKGDR